jgi:hypothetical protein
VSRSMACCGARRQQLGSLPQRSALGETLSPQLPSRRVPPAAGWGGATQRQPAAQRESGPAAQPGAAEADGRLLLLYGGSAALTLRSPLTGRHYQLMPGEPFWVERPDGELLLATGLCRRA